MIDRYGRKINYLRISVTDLCDFRCIYCMSPEGIDLLDRKEILTFEEITAVASAAASVGIVKLRLTGGEPLVRNDVDKLVSRLSGIKGIEEVAMTTNGNQLHRFAHALKRAGLTRLNISLDTLREDKFKEITRGGNLGDVMRGIEEARKAGFTDIKINVVVMRGVNDDEVGDFARYTLDNEVQVRFIEYMPIGMRSLDSNHKFVPASHIIEEIKTLGSLVPADFGSGNGPSRVYKIEGSRGSIGVISAMSEPFCERCNRLRLTADGKLLSCLLGAGEIDVKTALRSGAGEQALVKALRQAVDEKPLEQAACYRRRMSQIGG